MAANALAWSRALPGVALLWLRLAWLTLRFRIGGGCVVGAAYRRGGWPAVERLCREVRQR